MLAKVLVAKMPVNSSPAYGLTARQTSVALAESVGSAASQFLLIQRTRSTWN
jgi:hypothetical protein